MFEPVPQEPPVGGIQGQLIFWTFVVVILVVPWIMAGPAPRPARPLPTDSRSRAPGSWLFSSRRERRLWLYAAAVLVAIYSTLSPAQDVAAALRARGLLGLASGAVLWVVGTVLVAHWLRTRPGRVEVGAGLGIIAIYVATVVRLPAPEARSHLFEYSLLAMLVYQALRERRRNGHRVPAPPVMALVVTVVLGWMDEVIQAFLPDRVYDLEDVGLNAAFALAAIVASVILGWARSLDIGRRVRTRLGGRGRST